LVGDAKILIEKKYRSLLNFFGEAKGLFCTGNAATKEGQVDPHSTEKFRSRKNSKKQQ